MTSATDIIDTVAVQPVLIPREKITDNVCPKCGTWEITGEFVETGGGIAVQGMSCDVCDFRWKNIYDFAAIHLINEDLVIDMSPEAAPLHECSLDEDGICSNETEEPDDECRNKRLVASSKATATMTVVPEFEPEEEQVQVTRARGRGLR